MWHCIISKKIILPQKKRWTFLSSTKDGVHIKGIFRIKAHSMMNSLSFVSDNASHILHRYLLASLMARVIRSTMPLDWICRYLNRLYRAAKVDSKQDKVARRIILKPRYMTDSLVTLQRISDTITEHGFNLKKKIEKGNIRSACWKINSWNKKKQEIQTGEKKKETLNIQ